MLNNWSFSGLAIVQSGVPLTVTNATSGQGLGGSATSTTAALFSNVVAGTALVNSGSINSKLNNYINKAAWSKAPTGTVGNSGVGMFRGPGQADMDFSIFKNFPIREREEGGVPDGDLQHHEPPELLEPEHEHGFGQLWPDQRYHGQRTDHPVRSETGVLADLGMSQRESLRLHGSVGRWRGRSTGPWSIGLNFCRHRTENDE